jgi:hypothetical protein
MTTENTNKPLTVILDPIGRTILGVKVESNDSTIALENPVILHIVPADNQGKMSVQLLPLFFREFLADKSGDVVFTYDKARVTLTSIDAIDFRLQTQYSQMFNAQNAFVTPDATQQAPQQGGGGNVVNLFDE